MTNNNAGAVVTAEIFEKGFWRSCSGCHELDEGHPTGSYSTGLRCHVGNGCYECGGIGAVWEQFDDDSHQPPDDAVSSDHLTEVASARQEVERLKDELSHWQRCFKFPDGETDFALKRARFWLGRGETTLADGRPYPYAIEPDFDAVAEDRASEFAAALVSVSAERDALRSELASLKAKQAAGGEVG